MFNRRYAVYAAALAVAVIGALWAGVPAGVLAVLGLVLICPLMMLFMHGGQGADAQQPNAQSDRAAPSRTSTPADADREGSGRTSGRTNMRG